MIEPRAATSSVWTPEGGDDEAHGPALPETEPLAAFEEERLLQPVPDEGRELEDEGCGAASLQKRSPDPGGGVKTTGEFKTGGTGSASKVLTRGFWSSAKRFAAQQGASGLQEAECFRERRCRTVAQRVQAEDAVEAGAFHRKPRGVALPDVDAEPPRARRRDMGPFHSNRSAGRMVGLLVQQPAAATRPLFEAIVAAPPVGVLRDLIEHLGVELDLVRANGERRVLRMLCQAGAKPTLKIPERPRPNDR